MRELIKYTRRFSSISEGQDKYLKNAPDDKETTRDGWMERFNSRKENQIKFGRITV